MARPWCSICLAPHAAVLTASVHDVQVKESFQESQALQERFQDDVLSVREDAERRLAERSRHAKRHQVRLRIFWGRATTSLDRAIAI